MKKIVVGLDASPLYSAHQVRGIGFYTKRLLTAIKGLNDPGIIIKELRARGEIKKGSFDLLHIPYFSPFFLTLPLIKKCPLVITIHDLIPIKYPKHYPPGVRGKLFWQAQKILLRQTNAVVTDSVASQKDIGRYTGYPQDRVHVVYLAAGEEFVKLKVKNEKFRPEDDRSLDEKVNLKYRLPEKFVLYVGDVNWNKNIRSLVKACEDIKAPLVVVGKQAADPFFDHGHPENKDLVWLQSRAKRSNLIRLLGYTETDDLVSIYNLATVYCQPSFDEGFGLPVLEAMACGCPVVSSSLGSLREIADSAALLVIPSRKKIALALKRVLSDSQLRHSLSLRGKRWVETFSWKKTAQNTINIYRHVLGCKDSQTS